MRLEVYFSAWQIECCQPPPGVGDEVEWALQWHRDDGGPGVLTLPARPSPLRPSDAYAGTVLSFDGGCAWWAGRPQDAPAVGRLTVEAHGGVPDDLPRTRGVVRAVAVVGQAISGGVLVGLRLRPAPPTAAR